MGIENFEEFYQVIRQELKDEGIPINDTMLRQVVVGIDRHGPDYGPKDYPVLARSFVRGIWYRDGGGAD